VIKSSLENDEFRKILIDKYKFWSLVFMSFIWINYIINIKVEYKTHLHMVLFQIRILV